MDHRSKTNTFAQSPAKRSQPRFSHTRTRREGEREREREREIERERERETARYLYCTPCVLPSRSSPVGRTWPYGRSSSWPQHQRRKTITYYELRWKIGEMDTLCLLVTFLSVVASLLFCLCFVCSIGECAILLIFRIVLLVCCCSSPWSLPSHLCCHCLCFRTVLFCLCRCSSSWVLFHARLSLSYYSSICSRFLFMLGFLRCMLSSSLGFYLFFSYIFL